MNISYLHEFLGLLLDLDRRVQKQILNKLEELSRTPDSIYSHQALKGNQFKGLYKLRVGDWRLIYQLKGSDLLFITLGHRSEIYKKINLA